MVNCINGDFSLQNKENVFYKVSFNYYFSFIVCMDEKNLVIDDPQSVLDVLADALEEHEYDGCFVNEEDLPYTNECEYIVCGNHDLCLDTHGMMSMKEMDADIFVGVEVIYKGKKQIVNSELYDDDTIDLINDTGENRVYNVPLKELKVVKEDDTID